MWRNTVVKLIVFCVLMVLIRILKTGHYSFIFLVWNLFLAWLPYWFIQQHSKVAKNWQRLTLVGLSILFLPNAPYILTDLFHLNKNLAAPIWFDLLLISGFSILGLLFFLATVQRLFELLRPLCKMEMRFNLFKLGLFLSNGYGIYLGRYLRFNSWDVVSKPDDLVIRMFKSVFDSSSYKETLAITITFSIFLYLIFGIYESFYNRVGDKQNELP